MFFYIHPTSNKGTKQYHIGTIGKAYILVVYTLLVEDEPELIAMHPTKALLHRKFCNLCWCCSSLDFRCFSLDFHCSSLNFRCGCAPVIFVFVVFTQFLLFFTRFQVRLWSRNLCWLVPHSISIVVVIRRLLDFNLRETV